MISSSNLSNRIRNSLFAFIILIIFITISCATNNIKLKNEVTILPLGDSITYGVNSQYAGYRGYLNDLLKSHNISFHFLGSTNENPGKLPQKQTLHEGHRGYCIDDIFKGINPTAETEKGWLKSRPDYILLLIGTNNVNCASLSRTSNAEDFKKLLDKIIEISPSSNVLVGEIIPLLKRDKKYTEDFNEDLAKIVQEERIRDSKIRLVDMNSQFPTPYEAVIKDQIHPNDVGYRWIAQQWFKALDLKS